MQTSSDAATNSAKTVTESKKTRRRPNTFAQTIKRAGNMISGITEHMQTLSPHGLNDATIQTINTLMTEAKTLENEQEILKGKLKEKTLALNNKVEELKDVLSKNRLIIKFVQDKNSQLGCITETDKLIIKKISLKLGFSSSNYFFRFI